MPLDTVDKIEVDGFGKMNNSGLTDLVFCFVSSTRSEIRLQVNATVRFGLGEEEERKKKRRRRRKFFHQPTTAHNKKK